MTIELIHAIVRQTTVLIAQLATSGGWRAPLAQIADQVFQDLAAELERQGVSRKVSADMFGMGLRTYQRKVRRVTDGVIERRRSLWEVVLDFIRTQGITSRAELLREFADEDDVLLRGVIFDLCDRRLVFQAGQGAQTVYRAVSDEELGAVGALRSGDGLDELVWAIVYREGPLTKSQLLQQIHIQEVELDQILQRLLTSTRIELSGEAADATYCAANLYVHLGSPRGWEAAVFDHYQAVVKTILCRLREEPVTPAVTDQVGGSTYTLDVWSGHPLEQRACDTLKRLRTSLVELREEVEAFNAANARPEKYRKIVLYVGQCQIPQDSGDSDED